MHLTAMISHIRLGSRLSHTHAPSQDETVTRQGADWGKEGGKFMRGAEKLNFERKARVSVPQRDQQYQKLKSPP